MQTVRAFITQPAIDIAHGHRLILRNIGTATPARAPYLTHEGLKVLLRLVRGQHTEDFMTVVGRCAAALSKRLGLSCPRRPRGSRRILLPRPPCGWEAPQWRYALAKLGYRGLRASASASLARSA